MMHRIAAALILLFLALFLVARDQQDRPRPQKDEKFFDQPLVNILFPTEGLYQSADHGKTWQKVGPPVTPEPGRFVARDVVMFFHGARGGGTCFGFGCKLEYPISRLASISFAQWILMFNGTVPSVCCGYPIVRMAGRVFILTERGIIVAEDVIHIGDYGETIYKNWSLRPFADQPIESKPSTSIILLLLVGIWLPPIPLIHALFLHIVYRYINAHRSRVFSFIFSVIPALYITVRIMTADDLPLNGLPDFAKECALVAVLSGMIGALLLRLRSRETKIETHTLLAAAALMALPVPFNSIWSLWWGTLLLWVAAVAYMILRRDWTRYYAERGIQSSRWQLDKNLLPAIFIPLLISVFVVVMVYGFQMPYFYSDMAYQASPEIVFIGFVASITLTFIAGMIARPADLRKKSKQKLPRRVAYAFYLNVVWVTLSVGMGLLLVVQWHWMAAQADVVMRAILAYYFGV